MSYLTTRGHILRRPELSDYGITSEQYARHLRRQKIDPPAYVVLASFVATILGTSLVTYLVTDDIDHAVVFGLYALVFFPASGAVAYMVGIVARASWIEAVNAVFWIKGERGVATRIKLYESECEDYRIARAEEERERVLALRAREQQRRQEVRERERVAEMQRLAKEEEWTSLSGTEFEEKLGRLFEGFGYRVTHRGGAGDEGADLIVERDDRKIVVQCKRHVNPATPGMIRDLYGAMFHFKANEALLACTGGFTSGTIDFAEGKPITLWDVDDLVKWATELNRRRENR